MAGKEGRPSKYEPRFCEKVDEYLSECKDIEDENKLRVNLPTVEGFALFIGIPKRTLYDWREVHEPFSHSLEKIVEEQRKRLLNMGLSGDYNSTIAKLILSSNHGMSDKTDLTSDGKELKSIVYLPAKKDE